MSEPRPSTRTAADVSLAACVLLGAILLGAIVFSRPADGDEGIYLYASVLVGEGQTPYADFPCPQTPYAIYAFVPAGRSIIAARCISWGFGVLSLVSFALIVRRKGSGGVVALLAFATHGQWLAWTPLVKTYGMSVAVSLLALLLLKNTRQRWRVFFAGVCLALLVWGRLLYAPFAAAVFGWLCWEREERWPRLGAFIGGFALASLPVALMFTQDFERFVFSVYGWQRLREQAHPTAFNLVQRMDVLLGLLRQPQWLLICVFATWGFVRKRGHFGWLVLSATGSLVLASLIPTPCHPQYFCCLVPLFLLLAVPALKLPKRRTLRVGAHLAVVGYLIAGISTYKLNTRSSWVYFRADELSEIDRVCEEIRKFAPPGSPIVTFWPGYAALSLTHTAPGLQNNWFYAHSPLMSPARRDMYGTPTRDELSDWIRSRRYAVYVVGSHSMRRGVRDSIRAELERAGYHLRLSRHYRWVYTL